MSFLEQFSDDLEALVAKATPSVVGIERGQGSGTGFVLAPDGIVVTNHHVVKGARRVDVHLADGDTVSGDVVGTDPQTDLAVVRIPRSDRPGLRLAKQETVRIGQVIVAIGNPFRLDGSVSFGVVSAIQRSLGMPDGHQFEGLLQTDAAINPGNSGGPLVNARGEVVGVSTIVMPYAQGIGFGVPSSTVAWVTALLAKQGRVRRRYVGVGAKSISLEAAVARAVGQARGIKVLEVAGGTPAARAGLRRGDVVFSAEGDTVASVDDLQRTLALASTPAVRLGVWRGTGREELVVLTTEPASA